MIVGYSYPVWDGKKIIGKYWSFSRLTGIKLIVPRVSEFKRKYGVKYRDDEFDIVLLEALDDGVRVAFDRVISVRRKSKRQIKLLIGENK